MKVASGAAAPNLAAVRWALLFGNFVIGCGVMAVVGVLNDMTESLHVSVARGGQLITIAAAVMCFGAPLLAGWVGGFDRRRLLAAALLWYAAGHLLCALMPSYAALWPMRAATVLGAAVFTPQAAAAIGHMAPPAERGRSITFIFIGWSIASIAGIPIASWLGDTFGWRIAFGAIALLGAAGAAWIYAVMPDGVKPAALSRADWKAVLRHPVLMAMVLVTALSGAGQFTLFSYFTPYYKQALGASTGQITMLLVWFGAFGLVGNVVLTRVIDRVGPNMAVAVALAMIAVSLLLWPFGGTLVTTALILVPWALGCFSSNSAQQARLVAIAPPLAAASVALNSSAMYAGQAIGAASGGWLIAAGRMDWLHWAGFAVLLAAMAASALATRYARRGA